MKNNKLTYGIIGLGRFGSSLAKTLSEMDSEIMVVDKNEAKIAELREYTENAFIADTLDQKVLENMGFQNCDVVIVCIAESLDVSILTVMKLQSMQIKRIIAKANSTEHGEILKKLGAEVVYPEHDMAVKLAYRLETKKLLDFVQLSEKINISKIMVPKKLIGCSVDAIDIRKNFSVNIIAIENNGTVNETVMPDYIFQPNDILYVSGCQEGVSRLIDLEQ